MKSNLLRSEEYKAWLADIKSKVRQAQLKAAVKVNTELLTLYWRLGADIVAKQKNTKWGDGFLLQLSKDLTAEFPDMQGFSRRNLELIRQWYLFYGVFPIAKQAASQFGQQLVAQITQIPWWHNIVIIGKCKNIDEALFYVQNTIKHGWSRSVLVHQIESGLFTREGVVAEYSLSDIHKPIGISQYKLARSLPKKFKSNLPSIKEIENGLSDCG